MRSRCSSTRGMRRLLRGQRSAIARLRNELETFIALPPEEIFRYLVEPTLMARWIGLSHDLDPQPGGRFRVEVSSGNIASGHYVEVVPPRRVVFTWGWESQDADLSILPPGFSLVEIELK